MGREQLEKTMISWRREMLLDKDRKKYGAMTFALNFVPKGLELGYYAGRWIDEVVDGDEILPGNYSSVDHLLDETINQIETMGMNKFLSIKEPGPGFLFQQAIIYLQPLENKALGDDVKQEFIGFIEAMRWEYHRRVNRFVLSEDELLQSYWRGFSHAQNITLIALRAKERVPQFCPPVEELLVMPSSKLPLILPIVLGKAYAIRDFSEDWKEGIYPVPRHELIRAGFDPKQLPKDPNAVLTNPVIREWRKSDSEIAWKLSRKLRQKTVDLPTWGLIRFLTAGIGK